MATTIQHGYFVNGQLFKTAKEASDFARRPQVEAAMLVLANNDADFAKFLVDNEDEIEAAFEVGTIARVTKSERTKLEKACDYIAETLKDDSKAAFVVANIQAVKDSFRWPAVKRLKPEEKAAAALEALAKLADESVAQWLITNQEAVLAAYETGVEKRQAPAGSGLQDYLAAKKAGPEAMAAYQAAKAAKAAAAKA